MNDYTVKDNNQIIINSFNTSNFITEFKEIVHKNIIKLTLYDEHVNCNYDKHILFKKTLKNDANIQQLQLNNLNFLCENIKYIQNLHINNVYLNKGLLQRLSDFLKEDIQLISLNLANNNLKDVSPLIEGLSLNKSLKKINFHNNKISDLTPFYEILKTNNTLEILNLHDNRIVNLTPLFNGLQHNKSLIELYLYRNNIKEIPPLTEQFNNTLQKKLIIN